MLTVRLSAVSLVFDDFPIPLRIKNSSHYLVPVFIYCIYLFVFANSQDHSMGILRPSST